MIKKLKIFVFSIIIIISVYSQSHFQKAVGGNLTELTWSITQTVDNGYCTAGYTGSYSNGGQYLYFVKLNSDGSLQWTKSFGEPHNHEAHSIILDSEGKLYTSGYYWDEARQNADIFVMNLDSSGNIIWIKTYGGSLGEDGRNILNTFDGGFAVIGSSASFGNSREIYVLKLTQGGNIQWSKTYGGIRNEDGECITQTADSGFVMTGESNSFLSAGNIDMCILKTDKNGNLQWSKIIGGTNWEHGYSIIQTSDKGYAAAGFTRSIGAGNFDMYIVRLDSNGNLLWTRSAGRQGNDYIYSIVQAADGGFIGAGTSLNPATRPCILKIDSAGNVQWADTLNKTGTFYSLIKTADGGYAASGNIIGEGAGGADTYVVKFDSSFNTCGNFSPVNLTYSSGGTISSQNFNVNTPNTIVTTPSPTALTGGILTNICSTVNINYQNGAAVKYYKLFQNYPNPFNPVTTIKFEISKPKTNTSTEIRIYNVLGKEVITLVNEDLIPGLYEVEWDASNYPSGVYYYKMTAGGFSSVKKMVLIK